MNARKKVRIWPWAAGLAILTVLGGGMVEARTSFLQSVMLSRFASGLTFELRPGPSEAIRFPVGGPEDERRGYNALPAYTDSLQRRNYSVVAQAHWSPALGDFAKKTGYPVYHEKVATGLSLLDRSGASLYHTRYPKNAYEDFSAIPPVIVDTLRFIEDGALLDQSVPHRNPAVNWRRMTAASLGLVAGSVDPKLKAGGGSTLATQIEKFRHSPGGLTRGVGDKLEQMFAAATRSYLDGPDTLPAQQQIVWTYLNSTPLSARSAYGEVIGIADGLEAWYGTSLEEVSAALGSTGATLEQKAKVYRQVLSLLLAQRRPSFYLVQGPGELAVLTDRYLHLLAAAGIIDNRLRDAALNVHLTTLPVAPAPAPVSFVAQKASTSIRTELLNSLGIGSLYQLDRLDLTAATSFDKTTQEKVSAVLGRLHGRDAVKSLNLVGRNLLGAENDPSQVSYSVVVYEREADRNALRLRADNLDRPFDINTGSKLILGSTAKLRTVTTYLDIIARLHSRFEKNTPAQLRAASLKAEDPLTKWAAGYLAVAKDKSLQPMLDAAMLRTYSASPERFFTGGGIHVFGNYQRSDNGKQPTVEQALANSINLAFIRVMRDIRDYYIAEENAELEQSDETSNRLKFLTRFADQEGSTFVIRFYNEFRGKSSNEILSSMAERAGKTAKRLTIVFRSVAPDAPVTELAQFLAHELPDARLNDDDLRELYLSYGPDRYSLADRAYLAHTHPLKIWLAAYLRRHSGATLSESLAAGKDERQEAYSWLFKSHRARAQDTRIRIIREEDAFERILLDWRKQGYPFAQLVPSLASAIGSSGDRPDALAELMGILLNDGVRIPAADVERLDFASGTPYETQLALSPQAPKQVFPPEVAQTVRRALMKVVSNGTAAQLKGTFTGANGSALAAGGKTGTGDNRFDVFGAGHALKESRVVDRTATFVFFLGDRFYGTVTAFVEGQQAARYHFTSALAVRLLKALAPEIQTMIEPSLANAAPSAGLSKPAASPG